MSPTTLANRLRALFPDASGRSLKQWLESGRVEVNGRVCRDGRVAVRAQDRIHLAGRGPVPFPRGLGRVHERFQTPSNAVLAIGAGTLIALLLGDSSRHAA